MVANLVGTGITYSNVTFTGDPVATAIFTGGGTTIPNLGMASGVVLTTGRANIVPVNNGGAEGFNNTGPTIPELNAIAGANTFDGAILEFDFVPQAPNLTVDYIFGSDEYLEWVNLGYNDAFAFYISGPGIVGEVNIATVGGLPVTIDNINTVQNNAFFVNNTGSGNGPLTIEYDGFTTLLTAVQTVIPCSTYHIRLMIADGGDAIYDSGVFIEENGFYSQGAETSVSVQPAYGFAAGVEGCAGTQFVFTIPMALPGNTTINYTIAGTAIPGVDYAPLPDSIIIPAGQTQAFLPVTIFDDGITEGTETITMTVNTTVCTTETFTLNIIDPTPISVNSTNASFCFGQGPVNISASGSGGNGTISYTWNNGGGSGTPISVNPANTTVYTVTATDQCGKTATSNSTVTVTPLPISTFSIPSLICQNDPSTITYTGDAGIGANYIWNFGGGSAVPGGNSQGPHAVTWNSPGSYNVSLQVINSCTSIVTNQNVIVETSYTGGVQNESICDGESFTFGGTAYTTSGNYPFTFNTINGCDSTVTLNLTVNPVYNGGIQAESICSGESFTFGGNAYNQEGSYSHTFQSIYGCDSTVTLELTVNNVYDDILENAVICDGESYTFGGTAYTVAGYYTHTFATIFGCDSTVTLNLTVNPVYSGGVQAE
ncbi:MAG: choice-of-anchor L domain-containing protein, partial [Flavobacteriales bacterium]|nr:choice-of-anchor L domain-containing protein [Flavobacteriales bacterium]